MQETLAESKGLTFKEASSQLVEKYKHDHQFHFISNRKIGGGHDDEDCDECLVDSLLEVWENE